MAVYDPGAFYVKGVTHLQLVSTATRRVTSTSRPWRRDDFAGQPDGDPDVNMWTFGLHGGARFPMGGASVVTPYLNSTMSTRS